MSRGWSTLPWIARWLIAGSLAVLGVGAVFVLLVLFAPAIGGVSPNALYWSVSREVGGTQLLGSDGCRRRRGKRWTCEATDSQGSGAAIYEVMLDGDCWQARRAPGERSFEGSMAAQAAECVRLRDQVRLLDRAL